jgi:precorrin-2 dehydrogenase/sirohydrochlorin ferrochelatase
MRYYPIQLDVRGRRCLVVGGGGVGTRKVKTLLDCGARVTVVAPSASAALERLAAEGAIALKHTPYSTADVQGMFLVIGATDDDALNRRISSDAETERVLCNIADRPEACTFILPSIVQRGDLVITVSTAGKSPALAKTLRRVLEAQFGEEYRQLVDILGALRRRLLAAQHAPEAHKALFEGLIESDLLELIRNEDREGINRLLKDVLGEGYRLEDLFEAEPR